MIKYFFFSLILKQKRFVILIWPLFKSFTLGKKNSNVEINLSIFPLKAQRLSSAKSSKKLKGIFLKKKDAE